MDFSEGWASRNCGGDLIRAVLRYEDYLRLSGVGARLIDEIVLCFLGGSWGCLVSALHFSGEDEMGVPVDSVSGSTGTTS